MKFFDKNIGQVVTMPVHNIIGKESCKVSFSKNMTETARY